MDVLMFKKARVTPGSSAMVFHAPEDYAKAGELIRRGYQAYIGKVDEPEVDYIAVHEPAHIREHNHSPRFRAVAESILPDYKDRRLTLRLLQEKLKIEDRDE